MMFDVCVLSVPVSSPNVLFSFCVLLPLSFWICLLPFPHSFLSFSPFPDVQLLLSLIPKGQSDGWYF